MARDSSGVNPLAILCITVAGREPVRNSSIAAAMSAAGRPAMGGPTLAALDEP